MPDNLWEVYIEKRIYQADFIALVEWIIEGLVLPSDLVRRSGLHWIQAGKTSALEPYFGSATKPRAECALPPIVPANPAFRHFRERR